MANNNPTVIAASLNDQELKSAINKLVQHVDEGTKKMAASMDSAVDRMKKALNGLGNIKMDGGASSINTSIQQQQSLKQAVVQTTAAYDDYARAVRMVYARTNKIPTDDMDLARAKLERLQSILADINMRRVLSPAQIASSEVEIRKLESNLNSFAAAQAHTSSASSQSSQARQAQFEREETAIKQLIQQEKQRQLAIIETGLDARKTANQIISSMHEESKLDVNTPIRGVKELVEAIRKMRAAYFELDEENRESPLGRALKHDIEISEKALLAVRKYNQELHSSGKNDFIVSNNSSLASLRGALKALTREYSQLTVAQINAGKGDELVEKFQRITRAAQILQRNLSRPINLEAALGLQTRNLDDIAYKMQMLSNYRSTLNFADPKQKAEIEQVNKALADLQKKQQEIIGSNSKLAQSNSALTRSWNYMKNRLAFYFTVGASTAFVKNLIEVRSQYEMNERALGILIGSAERGTKIFNELSQMALVSPYTLIELSSAAKQLTAYDIAARDVVDTTRRLADMASAVGVPMERLTYALGQIKAYGYLNSRDNRMFANAGIPLVKQLADYYSELEGKMVSTADVYDRIKKKAVGFNDVMQVINKMTDEGGRFFDFQAKMADTLKVRLANLTLAWNNMLNDIGKENQGVLTWTIGALRDLFLHWKDLDQLLKNTWNIFKWVTAIRLLGLAALHCGANFGALNKYFALNAIFGKRLAVVIRTLAASMKTLFLSPTTWIILAGVALSQFLSKLIGVNEEAKELNQNLRENAKNTAQELEEFAKRTDNIRKQLYETRVDENGKKTLVPQNMEQSEALKAWEEIRNQIELSSHASQDYITQLMAISDVSERLRQGFAILDDVQVVSAALKEIGDDGIKVAQDWSEWWNLWLAKDGLIGNLKDYKEELDDIIEKYGTLSNAELLKTQGKDGAEAAIHDLDLALSKLQDDLKETTDSVMSFIELRGWSGDTTKIAEVFDQVSQQLIEKNQLDPQTAYALQEQVEIAKAKAQKEALYTRYQDLKRAWEISNDEEIRAEANKLVEEYKLFDDFNGAKKARWNDFTQWMKERHISEIRAMFRDMDEEQIRSLDFQSGEYANFVNGLVRKYSTEHHLAYDEVFNALRAWVTSANQWSIFIPLTISTGEGKSLYQELLDADTALETADKKIQRLNQGMSDLAGDAKAVARAQKEIAAAEQDKEEAIKKGGHDKKQEKADAAAAKRAAAAQRKRDAAAQRAHRQAQSELQGALKNELSLIDKIRSAYKTLTKDGLDRTSAIELATKGYGKTVSEINKTLKKYGLSDFDTKRYAGIENPRELVTLLNAQLVALQNSGLAKTSEIEDLQVKVQTLELEARSYELKKITDGLNNELGKLKDEYELAVELDATPELGDMFVDLFKIDTDALPHTFDETLERTQAIINDGLSKLGITEAFDVMRTDVTSYAEKIGHTIDSELIERLKDSQKYIRDLWKKEASETIKNWDKLLEKYAEYEYKVAQEQSRAAKERVDFINRFGTKEQKATAIKLQAKISAAKNEEEKQSLISDLRDVTKEVAGSDAAKIHIKLAIDEKETSELARIAFEEFQKDPSWITATGDLTNLTNTAIGGLIDTLERYKKSAKGLSPKQIKQINTALKNLYAQQRKGNPFSVIKNAIDAAKERFDDYQEAIDETTRKIAELNRIKEENGSLTEEEEERYNTLIKVLARLKKQQKDVSEINPTVIVEGLNQMIQMVNEAIGLFTDLANAIGGKGMTDAAKTISNIMGVVGKAGQGAAIGSQVGGGWGAAIGGIVGAVGGVISTFADQWSGNHSITKNIEKSERAVKRLANAYLDLDYAASKAYGSQKSGASAALIANKELQLLEKQRQLELEKSRKSKNKDEDKIEDLKGEIIDLRNEIKSSRSEIVSSMLGISSAGDEIETLVNVMIEAFRNGEDAMKAFGDEWDKMIDNMILKLLVTTFMQKAWDRLMSVLEEKEEEFLAKAKDEHAAASTLMTEFNQLTKQEVAEMVARQKGYTDVTTTDYEYAKSLLRQGELELLPNAKYTIRAWAQVTDEEIEEYRKMYVSNLDATQAALNDASTEYTKWALDYMRGEGRDYMMGYAELLKSSLGDWYTFGMGSDSSKNLSALQQGIQGITEDTAGAIEAYLNIISQRMFEHGALLTEIRDAVVTLDMDIQLSTLSQMLLQLQASYQAQMTIQSVLQGWSTPNGMAVRVELNN